MSKRWTEYGRLYKEKMRRMGEQMQPTLDAMAQNMAEAVVADPSLAGTGVDVGDWERGDIGACTFVYPSLEQAQEYLERPA